MKKTATATIQAMFREQQLTDPPPGAFQEEPARNHCSYNEGEEGSGPYNREPEIGVDGRVGLRFLEHGVNLGGEGWVLTCLKSL